MRRPPLDSVSAYYEERAVIARLLEYVGGGITAEPTAVYVTALTPSVTGPEARWELAERYPTSALPALLALGADVSRSLWDRTSLLVHLDLDYQNVDFPGEPFTHPAEIFARLEPAYRATQAALHRLQLPLLAIMTGRGYHFTGRIPLGSPVVAQLATLVPDLPAWWATLEARRPDWLTEPMSPLVARAYSGLGLLIEFLAQRIMRGASLRTPVPVVVNGTVVGTGLSGRACVSVDFSWAGDPLDARHARMAFSAYQFHRLRPDVVGEPVATQVPAAVAVPRESAGTWATLATARDLRRAAALAARSSVVLPIVEMGVARLLAEYLRSPLARFHRAFYATRPHAPAAWPDTYDRLDLSSLPPCAGNPIAQPNDRLLQPAVLQHVTRSLLARGWAPRHIAGLVHSRYARDFVWGTRWQQQDPQSRAEFDVRVFAGMLATGLDEAIDHNCRSAQEKGLCPWTGCPHNLVEERAALLAWHGV